LSDIQQIRVFMRKSETVWACLAISMAEEVSTVEPYPHQDIGFKILFFSPYRPRALQTLQASYMAMTSGESGILATSSRLVSMVTARPSKHRRYHPSQM
jgi:hypothetical protein